MTTHHVKISHLLGGVVVGVLVACQSRVNGDLGIAVNDGITAATWSFLVGWLFTLVYVLTKNSSRYALHAFMSSVRTGQTRWWECVGGLFGAVIVSEQGGVVPVVGVALFSVALVAGGTAGSLFVDRFGIGPAGKQSITIVRVMSALIATTGVGVAVLGDSHTGTVPALTVALLVALVAITGAVGSLQAALNGRIRTRFDDVMVATLVNFTVGLLALIVVGLALHAPRGFAGIAAPPLPWENLLIWTGGVIGVLFVAASAALSRTLGVLLLSLANVLGQVTGSLALDVVFPVGKAEITSGLVAGCVITVIAVVIGASRPRRRIPIAG